LDPLFSSVSDYIKELIDEATETAAHPHGTPSVGEASSKATAQTPSVDEAPLKAATQTPSVGEASSKATTQTPTESPSVQPSKRASAKTGWIRWTSRTIRTHIENVFGIAVSKETIRCVLHRLGLSWKKAKKLLAKANPDKRRAFVQDVRHLLDRVTHDEDLVLAYIDEAHVHQDADMGYGWSQRGRRLYVASSSPGLHAKVSFYGIYLYSESQVRIWPYERANSVHTVDVLERLRAEFPSRSMIVLWDGASYHRSATVLEAAARLDVQIIRLPTYSPDFMPVEALWHWLREHVTYNHCHDTARELIRRVAEFVATINRDAYEIADRLWVKDELDPEEENLRFST
jgi:transposase